MMCVRTLLAVTLAVMGVGGATACSAGSPSGENAKGGSSKCVKTVNGQDLFVGNETCLASLPTSFMVGYWIIDHECSVFYPNHKSAIVYDTNTYWAEISPAVEARLWKLYKGQRVVYRIAFEGAISDRPGIYGNGEFSKGVYIKSISSIRVEP